MVLKPCDTRSRCNFVAIYLLYAACCIQIPVAIYIYIYIYDPTRPHPVNMSALLVYVTEYILISLTKNEFRLCNVEQHKLEVRDFEIWPAVA